MVPNDLCPRCHLYPETLMHMLRDCEDVHEFWSKNINHNHWSKFFSLGLQAWLDWNLSQNDIGISHWKWNLVFGVACWALWRDKNLLVFSNQSDYTYSNKVFFPYPRYQILESILKELNYLLIVLGFVQADDIFLYTNSYRRQCLCKQACLLWMFFIWFCLVGFSSIICSRGIL